MPVALASTRTAVLAQLRAGCPAPQRPLWAQHPHSQRQGGASGAALPCLQHFPPGAV